MLVEEYRLEEMTAQSGFARSWLTISGEESVTPQIHDERESAKVCYLSWC